jgi:hypothetical protein
MGKTAEANWFCENRDCGWSGTLSLSDREEFSPRCVCGWPLKRANPPLTSHYLEFLHDEESVGKQGQIRKE